MNEDDRINFYLGSRFINGDFKIDKTQQKTIDEHRCVFSSPGFQVGYINPLKTFLNKTNNINKKFLLEAGDIHYKLNNAAVLVKNRPHDMEEPVILRCLNLSRHWGNYYNKPNDISFEKKKNKVYWRGSTTGNELNKGNRFELVKRWFNTGKNINIDVGFSDICQGKNSYKGYVKRKASISEMLKYKYILSVEGNDKDSGIQWKLNSNSVVFMARPRITSWLMETTLIPNYHYILLKDDFSDLMQKLIWCNENQEKCKEIIKNAHEFMNQFKDNKKEEELEKKVINKYFEIIEKKMAEENV